LSQKCPVIVPGFSLLGQWLLLCADIDVTPRFTEGAVVELWRDSFLGCSK
jgi:hypothetical protein